MKIANNYTIASWIQVHSVAQRRRRGHWDSCLQVMISLFTDVKIDRSQKQLGYQVSCMHRILPNGLVNILGRIPQPSIFVRMFSRPRSAFESLSLHAQDNSIVMQHVIHLIWSFLIRFSWVCIDVVYIDGEYMWLLPYCVLISLWLQLHLHWSETCLIHPTSDVLDGWHRKYV